jgi:hypothetical protein
MHASPTTMQMDELVSKEELRTYTQAEVDAQVICERALCKFSKSLHLITIR